MPKGSGGANKFREMTPAEQEAAFFKRERDLIHRDWVEAEKVIDAVRIALSGKKAFAAQALRETLAAYDRYIAEEKAKAEAPSNQPKKGLIST